MDTAADKVRHREYEEFLERFGPTYKASSYVSERSLKIEQQAVDDFLGAFEGKLIADIGSGPGLIAGPHAERNRIVAVDLFTSILKAAAERKMIPLAGNALAIPLSTGSCDATLVSTTLSSLSDRRGLIREVVRITRPGGRIYISATNLESILHRAVLLVKWGFSKLGLRITDATAALVRHDMSDVYTELRNANVQDIEVTFRYYPFFFTRRSRGVTVWDRLLATVYSMTGCVGHAQ